MKDAVDILNEEITIVRWDGEEDSLTAWQELVSALEDIGYQPVDNGHE